MICFTPTGKKPIERDQFDPAWRGGPFFLLCHVADVPMLQQQFNFDESTIEDCTDLDESVRFSNYPGYDFISLVRLARQGESVVTDEVNVYASNGYVILVMGDEPKPQAREYEQNLLSRVGALDAQGDWLDRVLFTALDLLLSDCSALLEWLEDQMEHLQERIIQRVDKRQFQEINSLRAMSYVAKKQLRASSYLGEQILVNANGFIQKGALRYYQNIGTRFKKLHDFSASLYEFSRQMLDAYDSRLAAKTNEAVNKLTILTVFFGPLTVITGIYGMNFTRMPELGWTYGYPMALVLMALVTGIVYWLIKKRNWL